MCLRLDSNQYFTDFKFVASTGWATQAMVPLIGFEPILHGF